MKNERVEAARERLRQIRTELSLAWVCPSGMSVQRLADLERETKALLRELREQGYQP